MAKVGQTKRRKRVKQSSQVQSSTSRKYILEKGENVVATGWTNTEHFIFDSCCDFLTKKNVDLNWSNINGLYESLIKVIDQYPSIAIPIAKKKRTSVSQKLGNELLEANAYRTLMLSLLKKIN